MARYIKADVTKEVLSAHEDHSKGYLRGDFEQIIDEEVPTADVVEVVRCKDCKWYEEQDETIGTCLLVEAGARIDGFCAWGERRDDGSGMDELRCADNRADNAI